MIDLYLFVAALFALTTFGAVAESVRDAWRDRQPIVLLHPFIYWTVCLLWPLALLAVGYVLIDAHRTKRADRTAVPDAGAIG